MFAVSEFNVEYVFKKKPLEIDYTINKTRNFSNIFRWLLTLNNPINVKMLL